MVHGFDTAQGLLHFDPMQACCDGQSEWEEHAMSEDPEDMSILTYHNSLTIKKNTTKTT